MEHLNHLRSVPIRSRSIKQTKSIGEKLGEVTEPGDLLLLIGDLGTGKTCLTQGIAIGLGIKSSVRSPTFILVNEHYGRSTLFHIDLYRIENINEVEGMGLDEYVNSDGVCVVEWANKATSAFPKEHLRIDLQHIGEKSRKLTFTAYGSRYTRIIEAISKD